MGLTHRRRLVLTASSVSGLILAALFVVATILYREIEVTEEYDGLAPTAKQALEAAARGQIPDRMDAIAAAEPEVSIALLRGETLVARRGTQDVSRVRQSGRLTIEGVEETAYVVRDGPYLAVAARRWAHREAILNRFVNLLAVLWFPLVGLIAGATSLASRATFRPLDELRQQADDAHAGGLASRLQVAGQDEYAAFATSLNGFLDRIEALVRNEEQFVADAAHELRTPLTALRGRVETTLLRERSPAEYRRALDVVLEEAERLSALVEALLGSATAVTNTPAAALDLEAEVERAQARWLDRFTVADVGLRVVTQPVSAAVTPSEIGSILDNLLANALRASPGGTVCRVELRTEPGHARLAVQDAGPGIPEEMRERIFQRFVRGEESRNRATGGFGIGLSLCRRIAEGRGGTIDVVPSPTGARFEVELPSVPAPPPFSAEKGRG